MAIIKSAEKMTVSVTNNYCIRTGKLSEIAGKINIKAKKRNLVLAGNKKIIIQAEKCQYT